jgi:hypothetical protein
MFSYHSCVKKGKLFKNAKIIHSFRSLALGFWVGLRIEIINNFIYRWSLANLQSRFFQAP